MHKKRKRVLLSTFVVKITDNKQNNQILSRFNGSNDFLYVFSQFLTYIFENVSTEPDSSGVYDRHFTLQEPHVEDSEDRIVYGYFYTGIGGDRYTIKDMEGEEPDKNIQERHSAFRNLFFYMFIPKDKVEGALILERSGKYGVKGLLSKNIKNYMRSQGYLHYNVKINNQLQSDVYNRMITEGNLKKVELIKKSIPPTIEDYFNNGQKPREVPGTLVTSMSSSTSLPDKYREFLHRRYTNPTNERIEIEGADDGFDEIEFELELNGKKKTFYMINRQRIQPDEDVSEDIELNESGNPTLESMLKKSEELVRDICILEPPDVQPH